MVSSRPRCSSPALARSSVVAGLALMASACVVPDVLNERPCPCADGWSCVPERNVCVRGGRDAGPALDDAGTGALVPRTCWVSTTGCDWSTPGTFELLEDDGAALSSLSIAKNALFAPDACSLYYASDGDVFVADRPNGMSAFGLGRSVGAINTGATEQRGTESPDGLELLFSRVDPDAQIFRARRSDPMGAWGTGTPVTVLNEVGVNSFDVALAPHGLDVYFTRVSGSEAKIYVAQRASIAEAFGPPVPLTDVAVAGSIDAEASVTADDRLIVFVTMRGADTERQAYYATRSGRGAPWGPVQRVPGAFLESGAEDEVSVSPDGCELIVRRPRGAVARLVHQAR